MNQTPSQTISITSKHVEDHLDSTIIQLAQVLGVEQQCTMEEANKIIKSKLTRKLLEFVDVNTVNELNSLISDLRKKRMKKTATQNETKAHEVLSRILGDL